MTGVSTRRNKTRPNHSEEDRIPDTENQPTGVGNPSNTGEPRRGRKRTRQAPEKPVSAERILPGEPTGEASKPPKRGLIAQLDQEIRERDAELADLKIRRAMEQGRPLEDTPAAPLSPRKKIKDQTVPIDIVANLLRKARYDDRTLPKFYGDVMQYQSFMKKYHKSSALYQLDDDENRERLLGALRGKARRLVEAKLQCPWLLQSALDDLEAEYGGNENMVTAVAATVERMRHLDPRFKRIQTFVIDLLTLQRMLKECDEGYFQKTILQMVTKNLPGEANMKWAAYQREIGQPKKGSFDDLVNCMQRLQDEIFPLGQGQGTRTRSPSPKHDRSLDHQYKPYANSRQPRPYRTQTPPRVMLHKTERKPHGPRSDSYQQNKETEGLYSRNRHSPTDEAEKHCVIGCSTGHTFAECPRYKSATPMEQFALRNKHRRCFKCLGAHNARECPTHQNQ